jgi:hypothetical protein
MEFAKPKYRIRNSPCHDPRAGSAAFQGIVIKERAADNGPMTRNEENRSTFRRLNATVAAATQLGVVAQNQQLSK